MPLPPLRYAQLLREKIEMTGARVYLVNTGWTGGSATSGAQRISIRATRNIITAILTGAIEKATFSKDPVFGTQVPAELPGVDSSILHPRDTWADPQAYDETAWQLARKFSENFKKYAAEHAELLQAGPKY